MMVLRRSKSVKMILTAAVLVALAGVGTWAATHKHAAPVYQTTPVAWGELEDSVQSTGVMQPEKRVDIGAQVSGQLQTLHVKLGDRVKKGQLLATIDPEIAKNDVLNLTASLEQVSAQRDAKQADLDQARREAARQDKMLAGNAAASTDAEQARARVLTLEADMRALSAQIRQAQSSLENARTRLGYTQISAPMDGDVVALVAQEGQTLNAVQQAPTILTLARLDTMTVKTQVAEADVNRLHRGQVMYFTTLGDSQQRYSGHLRTIEPLPEKINNAVFFNALFEVPNKQRTLWTDMTVQVAAVLGERHHVLTIPMLALGARGADGRTAVRVLNADKTVSTRQVRTGLDDHVNVEVLDGVHIGEQVIIGDDTPAVPGKP